MAKSSGQRKYQARTREIHSEGKVTVSAKTVNIYPKRKFESPDMDRDWAEKPYKSTYWSGGWKEAANHDFRPRGRKKLW